MNIRTLWPIINKIADIDTIGIGNKSYKSENNERNEKNLKYLFLVSLRDIDPGQELVAQYTFYQFWNIMN